MNNTKPLTEEALDRKFKASNGEMLTMREYLERAIKAFGLPEGDYEAAWHRLNAIAAKEE